MNPSGEKITRFTQVDLSTLEWTIYSDRFYSVTMNDMESDTTEFLLEKMTPECVSISGKTITIESLTAPKGKMIYKLATPTTSHGTPYDKTVAVDDYGTEKFITTNGSLVGHSTFYQANLHDFIQRLYSQTNGMPKSIPHAIPPASGGIYKLRIMVSNGEISYSWALDQ